MRKEVKELLATHPIFSYLSDGSSPTTVNSASFYNAFSTINPENHLRRYSTSPPLSLYWLQSPACFDVSSPSPFASQTQACKTPTECCGCEAKPGDPPAILVAGASPRTYSDRWRDSFSAIAAPARRTETQHSFYQISRLSSTHS